MLARPRCLPCSDSTENDKGTDLQCCFYPKQGAQGCVHPAVSRDERSVPPLFVLLSASNDGICIFVMTMTLVLLPCAGEKGLCAAAFLDPLNARSQLRSLFAWSQLPFKVYHRPRHWGRDVSVAQIPKHLVTKAHFLKVFSLIPLCFQAPPIYNSPNCT